VSGDGLNKKGNYNRFEPEPEVEGKIKKIKMDIKICWNSAGTFILSFLLNEKY
jgi:hypothetical protein